MRGSRKAKEAILSEVLVFYDEPQLLLLSSDRKFKMLAVAIDRDGMDHAFFVCELRDKTIERYLGGKADLHYAFRNAVGGRYYFASIPGTKNESVPLTDATPDEAANENYWPQAGIFARSHTSNLALIETTDSAVHVFKIDGTWAAADFSVFHGKLSDLYAFFSVLSGKHPTLERAYIKDAIQKRFWRGGGSYLGFYDELAMRIRAWIPLEVSRIQYASPGELAFRGDSDVFAGIDQVLDAFEQKSEALAQMYRRTHEVLRKERLLSAERKARFSNSTVKDYVYEETRSLANGMHLEKVSEIFAACDKDVAVFAKVVLSVYRRARELHVFQAEGRVQSVPDTAPSASVSEETPRTQRVAIRLIDTE